MRRDDGCATTCQDGIQDSVSILSTSSRKTQPRRTSGVPPDPGWAVAGPSRMHSTSPTGPSHGVPRWGASTASACPDGAAATRVRPREVRAGCPADGARVACRRRSPPALQGPEDPQRRERPQGFGKSGCTAIVTHHPDAGRRDPQPPLRQPPGCAECRERWDAPGTSGPERQESRPPGRTMGGSVCASRQNRGIRRRPETDPLYLTVVDRTGQVRMPKSP